MSLLQPTIDQTMQPPQQPQGQPPQGLLAGAAPQQPQDPIKAQITQALMQSPTVETMQAIIQKLAEMKHPKTQELAQLFQSTQGNPQAPQKDPMADQLKQILMQSPTPETMDMIVAELKKMGHPKAAGLEQMFNSVKGDPQAMQALLQQIAQS